MLKVRLRFIFAERGHEVHADLCGDHDAPSVWVAVSRVDHNMTHAVQAQEAATWKTVTKFSLDSW